MTDTARDTAMPAEVGGLWVPANPEHAKLGWTYDFEQTERIARAAYDSTGYDATMEVVEFVMAEADCRHRDALTTERATLEAQLAALSAENERLRKALERLLASPALADENHSDPEWGCEETAHAERAARKFLKENGNGE